jgi:hypothetical protein
MFACQFSIRNRFEEFAPLGILRFRPNLAASCLVVLIASFGLKPCFADVYQHPSPQSVRENQQLQRSIATIHAQQLAEVERLASESVKAIARRNLEVQWQVETLHSRNQDTLLQMRRAGYNTADQYGRLHWVPTYTPEEIWDTSQRMTDQEKIYGSTDHGQAQITASDQHRANALEVDASNLQSQLETDKSNHGFKLSPVGTNLYVRNYQVGGSGDDDQYNDYYPKSPAGSHKSPVALAAQPGRLPNANPKASAGITDRSAGKSGRVVQTTVTGQYLKP